MSRILQPRAPRPRPTALGGPSKGRFHLAIPDASQRILLPGTIVKGQRHCNLVYKLYGTSVGKGLTEVKDTATVASSLRVSPDARFSRHHPVAIRARVPPSADKCKLQRACRARARANPNLYCVSERRPSRLLLAAPRARTSLRAHTHSRRHDTPPSNTAPPSRLTLTKHATRCPPPQMC
mgnify:CR=1 FL=1